MKQWTKVNKQNGKIETSAKNILSKIDEKLIHLKNYNVDDSIKRILIRNLYKLANQNFNTYVEKFEKD